jgi:chorismate mutase/prephenate dehydrogenase
MDLHQDNLETWRKEIRSTDAEILRLVARRMELALKIGAYKQEHQMPVKDFRVEKQIIEKARESAATLGVYPNLAEDLMTTLIKYSVLRQDELKRERIAPVINRSSSALIVGGAGHMGQWFAQFYESLGFAVSIHDQKRPRESVTYPWHAVLEENLDAYELIVLATPMPVTNTLLSKLSWLKPRGTIVEICSLKAPIAEGLQAAQAAGLRIASLHPMFGPDADVLAGKNILFCTGPGFCSEVVLQQHFQQTSAELICLPLEEHDRLMSYILGSAHLLNLVYARLLTESGLSMSRLRQLAGTTFLRQLEVTSRVVAENPDLYYDIQILNHSTPQLVQGLKNKLDDFAQVILEERRERFKEFMMDSQKFLSEKDA